MEKTDHVSTQRIEAFSDAVFAIVLTLLVLELRVPALPAHFSSHEAAHALWEMAPEFISFATSFAMIAIFWVNHHHFFQKVKKSNPALLWYNNLLLFWLCFIPFPTAFIGKYPTDLVPVMVYGAALCLAGLSFNLLGRYAFFHSNLCDDSFSMSERVLAYRQSIIGTVLYALAVIMAPVSVIISLILYILVPALYFMPRKS